MSSGTSIRGKNSDPSELRIVLIGGRHGDGPSGKSSVGNIILDRDVFKTNRMTSKSVMRQKEVSGRRVTVVDTPGWMSHNPLDLTPKLTQLEIQQSVNLCPPGPHAFVLVMRLDPPWVGTGMSAEEHVRFLLSDRVWKHTIVVFTVADENNMDPDLIRSYPDFRYLIEKCVGRFHVLNISDRGDRSQVRKLMNKIDQMVKSNGCHYETEEHVSEELKEKKRTIRGRAEQRRTHAQKETTGLPKHIGLTDLRIVLLGSCTSGKSSAGNTILTGSDFKAGQRSVQCKVRQGEVAGRHVTVVDSPGWVYNSPLQDTSEMDKLEIQNSVYLCPPGPHAALLTVPLNEAFTKAHGVAVEEHMTLLSQRLWSHSIVLFTVGDYLRDRSIEQHIEAEGEHLRWLVDKCGNRYHVFNSEKTDDTQVTQLMEKIEEMVTGNRGGHCEDDGDEKMSERKRIIEEHVQTFLKKTHRQRNALKALSEGKHHSLPDVRLMLVGSEQNDRIAAGNRILHQSAFTETSLKEFKTQAKPTQCVRQQRPVADRKVSVVICPDWSTTPPSQKTKDVLLRGVTLCSPGPHAVLVTVDVKSSFSEADRRSVEEHMELLGDKVWRNTLILFMWGWWLGGRCVEEYIESEGEPLRWIMEKCGYRYHVLDGTKWDISEVTELVEKTEDMVMINRGHTGQLNSREDNSVRYTGHFKVGHETRQKTLSERLEGKKTLKEEEWKKEVEERREMLRFVEIEPEEPTLSTVRRSNSMDLEDMSGGTPYETRSLRSPDKVSDWLRKRFPGPIASSSGVDTRSEAPTQTDVMSALCVNMSSKEEEDEDSEGSMNMMKMIERESREEELKKTDLDDYDNDEVYLGSCCEKCQHVQQSYGDKMIVPEKLSRGCLQAQLEGQGTYECAFTGLIFEAKEQVLVSYSILSWSKFNEFVQNAWMIAGPIFNVQTVNKDASALKSIQFPHSLCLAEQKKEKVFGVLHVTGTDLVIERVQYSGSHLKWSVSSLSPVGSIARDTQRDEHHGAVLIYKDLWSSIDTHTFRIYLALNCSSWHEDIKRELELKKGRFSRVDKNPNCLLVEGKYQLMSTPREEIHPENLPFTLKPTEFKGYFEASFKQPLPFTFNVKLRGTDDTTWSANIQQGDLLKKPNMLQLLLSWFQLGSRKSNTCEATVSLQEQQSLHPESEPNTETDSHHVQSDVSSATALKPIISSGFGDDETVAEGVIKVADEATVSLQEQQSLHPESEPNTEPDSHHVQSDVSSATALKPSLSSGFSDNETVAEGVMQVADEATVSLQEQQSLHPESEPNTEPDSHHVQIQSDVSSTTALKPSLPSRFSDNETVAEGVMQVAGASGMKEPQISQTTDNFVKKNWGDLIRRVTDAMGIADDLFQKEILTDETYEKIWNARPRQAQMRILLHTVNLKGTAAISAFCDALQQHESCLFNDLAEGPGR